PHGCGHVRSHSFGGAAVRVSGPDDGDGVAGALWLAGPALLAMGNYNLVIFFVALVGILVALGVPIAFAFGLATLAYLAFTTQIPLTIVISRMDAGMSGLILL